MTMTDQPLDAMDVSQKAEEYLQAMTQLGKFSGAVLVAREGKVLHSAGYGLADREHGVANTPQTKYRIGSITKQFTAMAIMILEEQGKLNVHDPVSKYLPYSPDSWREITLHHLLNHTSGLVRTNDTLTARKLPLTVREIAETITQTALIFKVGTDHQYSNDGYILLGDIIERISGMSYDDFLQYHIFQPLDMADSGYDHHGTILTNRAVGYQKEGGLWVRSAYVDMGCPFSAGALYSTVGDLLRWSQALSDSRLITTESHIRMTTVTPLLANYGYGLAMGREQDRRSVSHAGGINGFRANLVCFPDERACIVVLSNSEASDFFGVTNTLGAILFGEKYTVPPVKTAVTLADETLTAYNGEYEIVPGVRLLVESKEGILIVTSGKVRSRFFPESETLFFREESGDTITFREAESGMIRRLTLQQGGTETVAERVSGNQTGEDINGWI